MKRVPSEVALHTATMQSMETVSSATPTAQPLCKNRRAQLFVATVVLVAFLSGYIIHGPSPSPPPAASPAACVKENTPAAAAVPAAGVKPAEAKNSATGKLFKGGVIRSFAGAMAFDGSESTTSPGGGAPGGVAAGGGSGAGSSASACDKWSVVTTIFEPSAAVKVAANVPGWCMIIVADNKTPDNYMR